MDHAYWGPAFNGTEISGLLSEHRSQISAAGCTVEDFADESALCRRTAAAIADGKVVGWFQGRMEWGPRALGNRSILCDPRRADMKASAQCQDQAAGIVSTFCAFGSRGSRTGMVRRERCGSVHDAGVSDQGGEASAHSCGHACRRLRATADGLSEN